jgi:hypothetical protein
VKVAGRFGKDTGAVQADAFIDSIERGFEALELGTSEFAPDVELVPDAAV